MTLKTLNELIPCKNRKGIEGSVCENCGTAHLFSEELLKKEAIKWYKYIKRKRKNYVNGSEYRNYCSEQMKFIKHFFNLTEKDLGDK